ncbi:MAG: hypothetical protein WCP19_01965 [Chloroflexota bacterium]
MNIKEIIGNIPFAADLYDTVRPTRPKTRYNLDQLQAALPQAAIQVKKRIKETPAGKNIVIFATLHFWVEQAVIIGLTLRGLGHNVTIAYLPYGDWTKEVTNFTLRRQDLYTHRVLAPLKGLINVVSLLDYSASSKLPGELAAEIERASEFDTMYTLQVEEIDPASELFSLRKRRNSAAARSSLEFLEKQRPDTVLIPNALVTELAVFYQVARHLDLQTVTYEFNDQREQIWLSQNQVVMHQNTDQLWKAKGQIPLSEPEREKIAGLENARTSASKYGKGTRFWQDVASVGGEAQRSALGLDSRPVVLLATNVLGDSLTLGRNIFTASMAEWISKTVLYFASRPDVQLVVRIHPGERLMKGPSSLDVINAALPSLPENIRLISPSEKINTYDLMEIASLGLAYTTTVGMEMAMRSVPVILAGQTHYRGRGFTYDPQTYDAYFADLEKILNDPSAYRLTQQQVETAWNYAYRFFFDFPHPFPWRLMHFWKDLEIWPVSRVLTPEGISEFGRTFDFLAGNPVEWTNKS